MIVINFILRVVGKLGISKLVVSELGVGELGISELSVGKLENYPLYFYILKLKTYIFIANVLIVSLIVWTEINYDKKVSIKSYLYSISFMFY